jgi:methyl-accepting chemotaxis protein
MGEIADEAGKGFAVVAKEFKMLAEQTARATADIQSTLARLTDRAVQLISQSSTNMERARAVREGTQSIGGAIEGAGEAIARIDREVGSIADATQAIERQCSSLSDRADEMAAGVSQSSDNFERARARIGNLLCVWRGASRRRSEAARSLRRTSSTVPMCRSPAPTRRR